MIYAELINAVQSKTGLPKDDVKRVMRAYEDTIKQAVLSGDRVFIRGFGTYFLKETKAREAYNGLLKKVVKFDSKKLPKFKAANW